MANEVMSKSRAKRLEAQGYKPKRIELPDDDVGLRQERFERRCDRCKKMIRTEQPVTATVFYCSIECAD